jgi:hypothetical protein
MASEYIWFSFLAIKTKQTSLVFSLKIAKRRKNSKLTGYAPPLYCSERNFIVYC